MALTGVRGLIATITVSLPRVVLFTGFTIVGSLLPGVLVTFGDVGGHRPALHPGPPGSQLDHAVLWRSLDYGPRLSCAPTGIGGLFAMRVVGETKYGPIFKKCIVPAAFALVLALLFMIYANEIGRIPGLRYVPTKGTY